MHSSIKQIRLYAAHPNRRMLIWNPVEGERAREERMLFPMVHSPIRSREKALPMQKLSFSQIVLLVVLGGLLVLTGIWAISVWNASGDAVMDKHGWIALGLGTFFSLLVGCGLMALMFFSSRSGHDDAADPFRKRRRPPAE
jgi:hypothetical protein